MPTIATALFTHGAALDKRRTMTPEVHEDWNGRICEELFEESGSRTGDPRAG